MYDDAEQLLQISQEKARNMVENLGFEQSKRKIFTYDVGMITERNKALTSLKRAEEFLIETRKMLQ